MKNKFTNFNDRSLEKKSSVENNNHKKSTIFHNHIEEDHCRIEKGNHHSRKFMKKYLYKMQFSITYIITN